MGAFFDLLNDVLQEYKAFEEVPTNTKAILASKYIEYLISKRKFSEVMQYLDLYASFSYNIGNCLINILYPHEKEGKLMAATALYERTRRRALQLFDKVLESEFTNRDRGKVYEFKRKGSKSIK